MPVRYGAARKWVAWDAFSGRVDVYIPAMRPYIVPMVVESRSFSMQSEARREILGRSRPTSAADTNGCGSHCCGCKSIGRLENTSGLEGWRYVLAAMWVFVLPCLGLIVGCGLAAGRTGQPGLQALAVAGGLATGVAVGMIGRRFTIRHDGKRPGDTPDDGNGCAAPGARNG